MYFFIQIFIGTKITETAKAKVSHTKLKKVRF